MLNGEWLGWRWRDSRRRQNLFQFTRAHDRVHFRNILANVVAKAFDQASGDDQFAGAAIGLVARHLQNGVHGFLLRAGDERTGVDHDDIGIFGARNQLGSGLRQHAHHDFAIHQILGAAQADEADLWPGEGVGAVSSGASSMATVGFW